MEIVDIMARLLDVIRDVGFVEETYRGPGTSTYGMVADEAYKKILLDRLARIARADESSGKLEKHAETLADARALIGAGTDFAIEAENAAAASDLWNRFGWVVVGRNQRDGKDVFIAIVSVDNIATCVADIVSDGDGCGVSLRELSSRKGSIGCALLLARPFAVSDGGGSNERVSVVFGSYDRLVLEIARAFAAMRELPGWLDMASTWPVGGQYFLK